MEFKEKLQELRKQKGLTQEELAEILFVSRTAISKWESGRGMPNIESLKAISKYFTVTLDDLLSSDDLLIIAEKDHQQKELYIRDMIYGLLDCSVALLFWLPFFGEKINGVVHEVSLLALSEIQPYVKTIYFTIIIGMTLLGMTTLIFRNSNNKYWIYNNSKISLFVNTTAVGLFIIGQQPYASIFMFAFLIIKALTFIQK